MKKPTSHLWEIAEKRKEGCKERKISAGSNKRNPVSESGVRQWAPLSTSSLFMEIHQTT